MSRRMIFSNSAKVGASLDAFVNSTISPRTAFSAATTDSNGLEDAMLNRSISTFLIGISFLPSAAKLALVLRLGLHLREATMDKKSRSRLLTAVVGCHNVTRNSRSSADGQTLSLEVP
jgi:hypothetical protein